MRRLFALLMGGGIGACYALVSSAIVFVFGGWELGGLILTMTLHPYLIYMGIIPSLYERMIGRGLLLELTSTAYQLPTGTLPLVVIDFLLGAIIALACYELHAFLLRRRISKKKRFLRCALLILGFLFLLFGLPFIIFLYL